MKNVGVLVDGTPMEEEAARAMWVRFSDWMEEHRGDLAGFAAKEGFASVHPGVSGGKPTLYVSHSAGQQPYAPVRADGGPGIRHGAPNPPQGQGKKAKDIKGGKRR